MGFKIEFEIEVYVEFDERVCISYKSTNSTNSLIQWRQERQIGKNWINKSLLFETSPFPIDWIDHLLELTETPVAATPTEPMRQDDVFRYAADIAFDWDNCLARNATDPDVLMSQYYAFQMVADRHTMMMPTTVTIHRQLPNLTWWNVGVSDVCWFVYHNECAHGLFFFFVIVCLFLWAIFMRIQ